MHHLQTNTQKYLFFELRTYTMPFLCCKDHFPAITRLLYLMLIMRRSNIIWIVSLFVAAEADILVKTISNTSKAEHLWEGKTMPCPHRRYPWNLLHLAPINIAFLRLQDMQEHFCLSRVCNKRIPSPSLDSLFAVGCQAY